MKIKKLNEIKYLNKTISFLSSTDAFSDITEWGEIEID